MKDGAKISNAVIKRLPRYRRYLEELKYRDVERISSGELSRLIGYTASQIRQDLNNFGGFGQQGYGYNVEGLFEKISGILGLEREYRIVIVGAGNLGQALANYLHTYRTGFNLVAMFDVKPGVVGQRVNDIEIGDFSGLGPYLESGDIDIGIITVNANAQEVAERLVEGGVGGIWNFAPVDIEVPDSVAIENVHLSDSLHSLIYYINSKRDMRGGDDGTDGADDGADPE
ncbi:MAG: redox-sensing transcriptional repressor Rex [Clostridiales Family XIII bacterium]|nr:redox-sensing transcriptional repressor Rex [Clostridiales Family XIII bacterium]